MSSYVIIIIVINYTSHAQVLVHETQYNDVQASYMMITITISCAVHLSERHDDCVYRHQLDGPAAPPPIMVRRLCVQQPSLHGEPDLFAESGPFEHVHGHLSKRQSITVCFARVIILSKRNIFRP